MLFGHCILDTFAMNVFFAVTLEAFNAIEVTTGLIEQNV